MEHVGMRFSRTPHLLAALTFALAASSASGQSNPVEGNVKNVPGRVFFVCSLSNETNAATGGYINASINFAEDGSELRRSAGWWSSLGEFPGQSESHGIRFDKASRGGQIHLTWSAPPLGQASRLDWAKGTFSVTAVDIWERGKARHREVWRQTFIDRDDSLRTYDYKGDHYLFPPIGVPALMTELEDLSGASLHMRLEDLMAWASGATSIKVYETKVDRRKFSRYSYPSGPAGARRIVTSYSIDIPKINQISGIVQERVEKWRDGIGDFKKTCTKAIEEDENDIIVL
jgi:hypothetical protein